MKPSTGIIIFFLSILALVAEFILYMLVGVGAAMSGDARSVPGLAFFFVSVMVLTGAAGVLAPICALIELVTKRKNLSYGIMFPVLGLLALGLGVFYAKVSEVARTTGARASSGGQPAVAGDQQAGGWKLNYSRSEIDDSVSGTLMLPAENEIATMFAKRRPALAIRCSKGSLETFLILQTRPDATYDTGRATSKVRTRLDDAKPETFLWALSTDGEGVFAPSGNEWPGHLALARRLLVEFTPALGSPQVVRFSLVGLDKLLPKVSRPCGYDFGADGTWKFDRAIIREAKGPAATDRR
jgi:hypothetical protein